jgi:hypothetical protein
MKLKRVNESTAVDKKGKSWFKLKVGEQHMYWVKCDVCLKSTQYFWSDYPKKERKICDACIEWEQ